MAANKCWSELVRLTSDYPNAMSPPEMHGYLVARLIDMKGLDSTPWLEDILGVREADEISEPVGEVASRFLKDLLRSFGEMETAGKLPDFEADGDRHWARDWARGFNRAVALRREAWDEHRDTGIVVARFLFLMKILDDPELYSKVSGRPPGEHEAFVERQVARIPSLLRLLYDDVLINPRLDPEAFDEDESEDADEPIELPAFSDEELRNASNDELVDLLSTLDDRVPENVIRECARRGEDIVPLLREVIEMYTDPERFDEDLWWGVLHCVHVLGLIPGANAGRVLLEALRLRDEDPDDCLWEWLSGSWPALFANKLDHVRAGLREMAESRAHDWMARADVMECLGVDSEEREANLDQIAGLAADETEEAELRELAGGILLDYPRERHRELLLRLAEDQRQRDTFGAPFDESEVLFAYGHPDHRKNDHFCNPWRFYDPENILKRQRRWRREDRERAEQEMLMDRTRLASMETIVRDGPKIGRNDPCHCGSGKKYKKCCLNN